MDGLNAPWTGHIAYGVLGVLLGYFAAGVQGVIARERRRGGKDLDGRRRW